MKAILLILLVFEVHAESFGELVGKLGKHHEVKAKKLRSQSLESEASGRGSWGDPKFKLAAKNYPQESLKGNQTPMSGVELSVSQRIALTPKYGQIKEAYRLLAKAKNEESVDTNKQLVARFWFYLIEKERIRSELSIAKENLSWIEKILKVSSRLYSTGKISQQALLDIKIRKSELDAIRSNREMDLKQLREELHYLFEQDDIKIDDSTIPWNILDQRDSGPIDNQQEIFEYRLRASRKILNATRWGYIPDLTISVAKTFRSNIDGQGDFVSGAVTLSLPLSSQKYSDNFKAYYESEASHQELQRYKRSKVSRRNSLDAQIESIEHELSILNKSTILYSTSSRDISAKAYSLGSLKYSDLLQAELKLQELLLKKSRLIAALKKRKVEYKLLIGERLYE